MKKILFIFFISLIAVSCKHEIEKPTWDVDMITPIAYTNLNIDNIIPDSDTIISVGDEGLISLVYQQSLLDVNYDSLLILETTSEETSIRIDSVDFDDVVIEHNITIGSVINEIPLGTFAFPDGSQRDIPC